MEKEKINVGDYVKVIKTSHSRKEKLIKEPVIVVNVWSQNRISVKDIEGVVCKLEIKTTDYIKILAPKKRGRKKKLSEVIHKVGKMKPASRLIVKNINPEKLKYFLSLSDITYLYKSVPKDVHFNITELGHIIEEIHESKILSSDIIIENFMSIREKQLNQETIDLVNSLKIGDLISFEGIEYNLIENHSLCYLIAYSDHYNDMKLIEIKDDIELKKIPEKIIISEGDYVESDGEILLVESFSKDLKTAIVFSNNNAQRRTISNYTIPSRLEILTHLHNNICEGDVIVTVEDSKLHVVDQILDDQYITTDNIKLSKDKIREALWYETTSVHSMLQKGYDEFLHPSLCRAIIIKCNNPCLRSDFHWLKNENKKYELVHEIWRTSIPAFIGTDLIREILPSIITSGGENYKKCFKKVEGGYSCSYVIEETKFNEETCDIKKKVIKTLFSHTEKTITELAFKMIIDPEFN